MAQSNIKVDRQRVIDTFAAYVKNYDDSDTKVILKIQHTYRVAGLCQQIAASIGLEGADKDIAWLCGMLHDVGRFEQLRRFDTFDDSKSVNHAHLGCKILFEDGMIRNFIEDDCEDTLVKAAINCHSDYRIPEDFDDRTKMYANILRDADKIDILKVNCDFPLEEIYNSTKEELKTACVTEEVFGAYNEEHTVLRSLKRTVVDHVAGHASLVFELVYPESVRIAAAQGYIEKLLAFESDNPDTMEKFEKMRQTMDRYIKKRLA